MNKQHGRKGGWKEWLFFGIGIFPFAFLFGGLLFSIVVLIIFIALAVYSELIYEKKTGEFKGFSTKKTQTEYGNALMDFYKMKLELGTNILENEYGLVKDEWIETDFNKLAVQEYVIRIYIEEYFKSLKYEPASYAWVPLALKPKFKNTKIEFKSTSPEYCFEADSIVRIASIRRKGKDNKSLPFENVELSYGNFLKTLKHDRPRKTFENCDTLINQEWYDNLKGSQVETKSKYAHCKKFNTKSAFDYIISSRRYLGCRNTFVNFEISKRAYWMSESKIDKKITTI